MVVAPKAMLILLEKLISMAWSFISTRLNFNILTTIFIYEKLRNAIEKEVSVMEIIGGGTGIHWPLLDEDLSVTGILEGRFGHV